MLNDGNQLIRGLRFINISNPEELAMRLGIDMKTLNLVVSRMSYKKYMLIKMNGNTRLIYIPDKSLRILQKRLNIYLQEVYVNIKSDCSYGFVRSINAEEKYDILSNAGKHAQKKYLLNLDLKDFFHSIRSIAIHNIFKQEPFLFSNKLAAWLVFLTTYNNLLPAGAPTSPILSNFVCLKMDLEIEALCKDFSYTYTRYVDDLSFSGDANFSQEFIDQLKVIIVNNRFQINYEKFRINTFNSRQVVTGLVVNEKPNINRKYIRKIRAILHNWGKNGIFLSTLRYFEGVKHSNSSEHMFVNSVLGKINFIGYVRGKEDPVYIKLLNKFQYLISQL
jgi:RNA-directed DNA polymerase